MKQHYFYYLSIFLFFQISAYSQTTVCGTSEQHEFLLEHDSVYRKAYEQTEVQIQSVLADSHSNRSANIVYQVPVVVHVIHVGEPLGTGSNISDTAIIDAISYLNNKWTNSVGTGINVEVQFCLATRDPNGNATNGINRVNGSGVTNYSIGGIGYNNCNLSANEGSVKGLSKWPSTDYYNIWVVKEICNGSGGISGFAHYPIVGNGNDGAVMLYSAMNSSYFTLPHEMGHAFNLMHTFEGDSSGNSCPSNTSCTTDGDKVCDTPPHKRGDCSTSNPCSASGTWTNSSKNLMSYCAGANRFTQGQKDRIRACFAIAPRMSLLNSAGCGALDVSDTPRKNFRISPNPAHDSFIISHNLTATEGTVQIYNLLGEKVWQQYVITNEQRIYTGNLRKGVYLVVLNIDGFQNTMKLVIE